MATSAIANAGLLLKNEDIATKQHSVWRTKIQFQNPALAIAVAVATNWNGMEKITLIGLFLGLVIPAFGQPMEDQETVIQMSIDLADLQEYYHWSETGEKKPLVIMNDGVVPPNLKLEKFGEPVQFMAEKELFFIMKNDYLDFEQFEISPTRANVEFLYAVEGLTINLTFEKSDENWEIMSKELKRK